MPTRSIDVLGQTRQNAGWKVVVDNYVECYHCRHAHPDFASLHYFHRLVHEALSG